MGLSDFFIRRPVFAIVINVIMAILGLYGLTKLQMRELPAFEVPFVTVTTVMAGASPELIETQISTPIEQAVATIDGIDTLSSTSIAGLSTVKISFKGEGMAKSPAVEVRTKVEQVRNLLPADALPPTVMQLSTDAIPVLYLSLNSASRSELELTELYDTVMRTPLSAIEGVAQLTLLGERKYAIRIKVDPVKLAAYSMTNDDVRLALIAGNAKIPVGSIKQAGTRIDVIANTSAVNLEGFKNIVLRAKNEALVRLSDVAEVVVGADNTNTGVLIDGKPGLAVGIIRQPSANALTVAGLVKRELPGLRAVLPTDVTLAVAFDSSIFIKESVVEVFDALRDAVILVIVVIFLFLGSIRGALVTVVTIPLSLIGTLAFMALMGYSLNTFSLLAIVLAVGLVVDDAIVDVENVQRHIVRGLSPMTASFVGSREIGFAVIATTLTLASVYLPIGFLPGLMGKLFSEFAFTLAAAVLISGFISRTLSPMMCSRMLKAHDPRSRKGPTLMDRFTGAFRRSLELMLTMRWLVYALMVSIGVLAVGASGTLPGEMAPVEDQGYVFARFAGPPSSTYEALAERGKTISAILDAVPEKSNSLVMLGNPDPRSGLAILVLKPASQRKRDATQIGAGIEPSLKAIPGLDVDVVDPGVLSGGGQLPVQMVVRTTGSYADLAAGMDMLLQKIGQGAGVTNPQSNLRFTSQRLEIEVDRDRAGDVGADLATVANAVATAIGGFKVSTFTYGTRTYNVIMDLGDRFANRSDSIEILRVRTKDGTVIPLSRLISIRRSVGADQLEHFEGQRSATLSGGIEAGRSLGQVLDDLERISKDTLPAGMSIDWDGASRQLRQANVAAGLVFLLSFVFIYGFLAAQFESFRDPFIVLLVVPFAVFGSLLGLKVFSGSLNLYSSIGLITLVGLVAKQGILITEFANQLREEGRDIRTAVVESATARLRPILMTTAAMVVGAAPLIYNSGSGSNSRYQIGVVLIGGMIVGTLLALYVVPATYTLMSKRNRPPLASPPSDEESRRLLHGQFDKPVADAEART